MEKNERYELRIEILVQDYMDDLIVCLARQGYSPYISFEGDAVCITVESDELTKINAGVK